MWRLCALSAVLLLVTGEPCDNGRFNIHLDLPDESAYVCKGDFITPPSQVSPSLATKYKQELTHQACMDVEISYSASIPNSGAHRPQWAKYGEYIYCPPQRYIHNLQHAGVAFLYHPCVDPQLKGAFSYVARRYVPRHIITPLPSLSRERPLALAAWCSTFEMSHPNLSEISDWLNENVYQRQENVTEKDGTYQHLLIRPARMSIKKTNTDKNLKVLPSFSSHRDRSVLGLLKKKRAVAALASGSASVSITPAGHSNVTTKSTTITTMSAATDNPTHPTKSSTSVISKSESQAVNIHSRESESNEKGTTDEPRVNATIPPQKNLSNFVPELNVSRSVESKMSHEKGEGQHSSKDDIKDQQIETHQKNASLSTDQSSNITLPSHDAQTEQKLSPTTTTTEQTPELKEKPQCSCKQNEVAESPSQAQRRLGAAQQKSSDTYISTPRTEEASWAAASLILIFALLTFSVMYTQIYKKFRKSQSLYWTPESLNEERETVASIIKRRLVQGPGKRKKWFGRKKPPRVLYESLSESSD